MTCTRARLDIKNLHAWYGDSHVLHGIDMHIRAGETVTLLGRNGAGKTTTLRAIMGLIRQRSGVLHFDDHDLMEVPLYRVAHTGLGYIPEERGIFSTLSVEENLLLPPKVGENALTLEEIYDLFPNLRERRASAGTKLSGGEQQMLSIARILRTGANTLLIDEPTEGLAPIVVKRISEVLRLLKSRGITILLVEQNFQFAKLIADRFYLIENGRVIDSFEISEITERERQLHEVLGV